MLTLEENERLTRVGPGTPMGQLFRRYWMPIAVADELGERPVKRVRVLGEDLALYRDTAGRLGLVVERCPHRGASLAYGFPTDEGLRCPYHGWLFDGAGACLEQPNQREDSARFRDQCGTVGYPVTELGGLIFAYLGPLPAPLPPPFDLFVRGPGRTGVLDIGIAVIPCNWLQIMENSFDPTHVEWLHGHLFNYLLALQGEEPTKLAQHHMRVGFDRFDYGIIKRRLEEGQSEDEDSWRIGHPVVFPNILRVGSGPMSSFQIRVPVDDETTMHYWYCWYDLEDRDADLAEEASRLPNHYPVPVLADDGAFLIDNIDTQDAMVWMTQGRISDRTLEHLCQGDRGVVLYRQLLEEQLVRVDNGEDPMAVIREVPQGGFIEFPQEKRVHGMGGETDNYLNTFLRTQGVNSVRLTQLVRLIDERLAAG